MELAPGSWDFKTETLIARILPLNLLGLFVGTTVCWAMSLRDVQTEASNAEAEFVPVFRVNFFKAMIPVIPLVMLFLTGPPLKVLTVPTGWLIERKSTDSATTVLPAAGAAAAASVPTRLSPEEKGLFDSRLIGAAMLAGVVVAALSSPRVIKQVAGTFFEGAGYGFANIISLIVAATCFGKAIKLMGYDKMLGDLIAAAPIMLLPLAGMLPMAFGVLCGSGMATTQSLFAFFAKPAIQLGIDPFLVGAVVSLASGAGRTLSPFSAVTQMSATLTKTNAMQLSARVALPLLCAVAAEVAAAMMMAAWGW